MAEEARIIELDQAARVQEEWHYDHATDTTYLRQVQDVSPIVEYARAHHDATPDRRGRWRGEFVPVASVPLTALLELMQLGIVGRGFRVLDERAFYRWLQENRAFKLTPGRF